MTRHEAPSPLSGVLMRHQRTCVDPSPQLQHPRLPSFFFFFNDPPPTEISPLPLHTPLPIFYGKTSMKAATSPAQYHWPGPPHEGNGTAPPTLDDPSPPPQREAVLQILSGKAGNAWICS